jgi:hypothetical protein
VRSAKFDQMKRLKVLPDGVTKTQFLGLPDPLQMARQAMSTAQGEQDFRASMDQFQSIYGDAPEAAQAWNAMQVFMNNQYYSRVKPQTPQRGLLKQIASPWSDMTEEQGLRMREQFPYGIGKAN